MKGTSKAGRSYSMQVLKCVARSGDQVEVGELVLPQEHPTVSPGTYQAIVGVRTDREGRLSGRIMELVPLKRG